MRERLEKYTYAYTNVEVIKIKQGKMDIPVDSMISGEWKLMVICSKKSVSGVYFYNSEYVSQSFADAPLMIKEGGLKIILNDDKLKDKLTEVNKFKIYKNGFSLDKQGNLFVASFMGKLCGFMIVYK